MRPLTVALPAQDLTALAKCSWGDLTETQPDDTMTPIERAPMDAVRGLGLNYKFWRENGAVILPGLIPHDVIDEYVEARGKLLPKNRTHKDNHWAGWHYPTPYMVVPKLLNLATYHTLQHQLHALIGDPMGLHLTLTGWVSTERNWHQDSYLNPDYLWSWYAAAWIALDDIDEDSGPFEYVPGSHTWPVLRRHRLFEHLTPEQQQSSDWPTFTQGEIARVCEAEMERRGAKVKRFVPKKGDVLVWHSNLLHRGSAPKNPELERRSLICHYSALTRRLDMGRLRRNPENGILYFDLPTPAK